MAIALPGKGQETIPGPVPVPSGKAFEQLPLPVTHNRLPQYAEAPVIELRNPLVYGFVRSANQMGRDALGFAFELSLVKKLNKKISKAENSTHEPVMKKYVFRISAGQFKRKAEIEACSKEDAEEIMFQRFGDLPYELIEVHT